MTPEVASWLLAACAVTLPLIGYRLGVERGRADGCAEHRRRCDELAAQLDEMDLALDEALDLVCRRRLREDR